MVAKLGDKVKIRSGSMNGQRGVVERTQGNSLVVRTVDGNELIELPQTDVTNFSLAARKAWKKMPKRRVGRPRRKGDSKRISVTLRIDRDLWDLFQVAESAGKVADRSTVLNAWIREKLSELIGTKE